VVQEKPRRAIVEIGYRNSGTEVIMDKNQRSKGQTKDFSRKKCLSELHNSNSGLKKELV